MTFTLKHSKENKAMKEHADAFMQKSAYSRRLELRRSVGFWEFTHCMQKFHSAVGKSLAAKFPGVSAPRIRRQAAAAVRRERGRQIREGVAG